MTRLIHSFIACLMGVIVMQSLSSCTGETDEYFDQSASARLTAVTQRTLNILRSAEHGWELEYYPGASLEYGGVVYTVKFDSLTATVACSLIPDSTETSLYKLTNDNGPVLSFDSYNALLHYYATPSASEYEAKGGDFEFVIDSISDNLITLFGKRTGNTMYLRRLAASPDEYAAKTIAIFDHFADSVKGQIGTAVVAGKVDPTSRSISVVSGRDTLDVHYTYTDRGIRLYRPLRLGGLAVQSFDYDIDTHIFTCTDEGAEAVSLEGVPYADTFMSYSRYAGDYTLSYTSDGTTDRSASVSLVPNRLDGTYAMKGLSSRYDLLLHYIPSTGDLQLGAQIVGAADGNTYYWAAVKYASGSISNINIADEGQFTIRWNGNRFYPRFNITPTNTRISDVNSGLLIYLYYDENGQLSAGLVTEPDWLTNGSYLFANLKSLNRLTRME
ncbi:MAG: DUF4302 domain-containing protein [Prevotella sp.]|nr:DUF4302 domain-containing protein [Prevotella sp.]